jgi:hypothetical protein
MHAPVQVAATLNGSTVPGATESDLALTSVTTEFQAYHVQGKSYKCYYGNCNSKHMESPLLSSRAEGVIT